MSLLAAVLARVWRGLACQRDASPLPAALLWETLAVRWGFWYPAVGVKSLLVGDRHCVVRGSAGGVCAVFPRHHWGVGGVQLRPGGGRVAGEKNFGDSLVAHYYMQY